MANDFYKPSKWRLQEIYHEGKIVFVPQYKRKYFWKNVNQEEFENVYLAVGYIQIGWMPFKVGFKSEKFAKDFIQQVEERRQRIKPNPPMPKQRIWHSIKNLFPKYTYIE